MNVPAERLRDCPARPNCVCSQAADPGRRIAPLAYTGPAEAAFARLLTLLAELPRTRLVAQRAGYARAEVRSALFRFTDDVECLLDATAGLIHLRSASRIGWSDLGTNRRRMEALRARWEAGTAS